jgi:pantoate--beta-alanine ligase
VRTLRTIPEVRAALMGARQSERRIGLVPTMGAFHDGHVSLMRAARSEAEIVVVSLFVNPSQFGPDEDLARYPRMESDDAARASDIGVDFMFAPSVEEMYPPGFATSIDPGPVAHGLWGTARPGHFAGVATVVARLFGIVAPDIAYFGLKDFQQVAVIRRLVADLALPIEIRALPTIREPDGLAMSSRNRYLSDDERNRARAIFDGLRTAADAYAAGERDRRPLVDAARAVMEDAGITVEFVELRDAETLGPYSADRAAVLAVSARIGDTNLIDNLVLAPQLTAAPRKIETWSA